MTPKSAWADFFPRIGTAVFLAVSATIALTFGGYIFGFFLLLAVALIHWELGCMLNPLSRQSGYFAAVSSAVFFGLAIISISLEWSLICVGLGSAVQLMFFQRFKRLGLIISISTLLVSLLIFNLRFSSGLFVVLWLIGVVVVTDVGGYFGGRLLGGPKLIPRYSPQKTWAGTLTGWTFAIALSLYFGEGVLPGLSLQQTVIIALSLSIASQVGDIFESAFKRACDVKDSSSLLPGHGGLMDRFDGLIAASLVFGLVVFLAGL